MELDSCETKSYQVLVYQVQYFPKTVALMKKQLVHLQSRYREQESFNHCKDAVKGFGNVFVSLEISRSTREFLTSKTSFIAPQARFAISGCEEANVSMAGAR